MKVVNNDRPEGHDDVIPKIGVNASATLRVQQFRLVTLTRSLLTFEDSGDYRNWWSGVQFNVTAITIEGSSSQADGRDDAGKVVMAREQTRAVRSFTVQDLVERRLAFYPTTSDWLTADRRVIVELTPIDPRSGTAGPPVAVVIVVASAQSSAGDVRVVYGPSRMMVNEGGRRTIDGGRQLAIVLNPSANVDGDELSKPEVQFHVKSGPRHGILEISGIKCSAFSWSDLVGDGDGGRSRLVYRHDGSDTFDDRLILRVEISSRAATGVSGVRLQRMRLPIAILPVFDASPRLSSVVDDSKPIKVTRGGFTSLTTSILDSNDKNTGQRNPVLMMTFPFLVFS